MSDDMPSWDDLRILLAVHRGRSFVAAGKSLGVAASTVARRMEALEASVGHPLVHRGNDGVRLDPDALRLVALGEEFELGLAWLRRSEREDEVSGTVRVSISEGLVRSILPVLARLRVKHPGLVFELVSESRLADLARREADIGLRVLRSESPTVVSKRMGRAAIGLFASRDYVARRLPSARLTKDAAPHQDWIGHEAALSRLPHEVWVREYGARRFVLRSNSSTAIEHAVLAGMGIGVLAESHGLATPGLVLLDIEGVLPPAEIFLAFHRDARKTPRIRVVVRELEAEIRRHLG